ncbi:von Willebrand factor type A domain-containing protein [Dichotomopilus funicola]|uniref:von Willebrand factor type A domain-containing protein n=1 Tax=Dichotomopilus funicola TaxID=1934379 RepID=A0AAN6UWZ6_9PEZI|nr:von Willebrand factor type A domain-containing protein [Dichotomopilus funicola]
MADHGHVCGLYYIVPHPRYAYHTQRKYLQQLSLSAHTKIVSSTSRTTLTQNFVNPKSEKLKELRYTFPLYAGVSVVDFVCTINEKRVIRGVVKERAQAKKTYQEAVDRGETAGLLEQLPEASDVFTTTIGNVPENAELKIEITYLGELKQDVGIDGIRFTIPTSIAPRFGDYPGELEPSTGIDKKKSGISIVVDVELPAGSNVKNVQSPSHPISVTLGNTAEGAARGADMSLQKASATLALSTAELGDDFVLQVVATNTGDPVAVLETHPTLTNHRALMATLVPKFNLPASRPEIVFLCDRSGSMMGSNIANLKTALQLFLKSLPVGVKFNICSFGSRHEFLFPDGSQTYDQSSLKKATAYVDTFEADFGGTDIYDPMEDAFKKRYTDMDLEVFLLTDGEIWNQAALFKLLNEKIAESKGRARVFSLGIGSDVSHSLIEGVAEAGHGFAQSVGDDEKMNTKVVRMLKASLTPHIDDYKLEIKYGKEGEAKGADAEDEFEIVEKVLDGLVLDVNEPTPSEGATTTEEKKPISFFDKSADPDVEMADASLDTSSGGKYSHVPAISEPKFLQAPFLIPPILPYSRTTVYVLFSPETIQKQPKSVILRGTSRHGPIALEIPVTVLEEKSETIHQLAARKAIREMEDGRGWIFHAKDSTADGAQLVKDKYPGRFQDMVEREAVRLGVTHQVGGKWCSFVAVEGNEERHEQEEPSQPEPGLLTTCFFPAATASFAPRAFAAPVAMCASAAVPPPPAPGGGSPFGSYAAPPQAQIAQLDMYSDSGFSTVGMPRRKAKGMRNILPSEDEEDEESDDQGFGLMDDGPSFVEPEDLSKLSQADQLNRLVDLQTFEGSWACEPRLLGVIGRGKLDEKTLSQAAAKAGFQVSGSALDALATALALAFLEKEMADEAEEWEMLAEKANMWLEGKLGEIQGEERGVEEYCEAVKRFWENVRN